MKPLPRRAAWGAGLALAAGLACADAPPAPMNAAKARLHYIHHCIGCHRMDGSGLPASNVPSMRGALGRFLQVPGGREFIVQVPGVMNSALNDAEIARLMNWLLPTVSAPTVPADTPPYTADEVARLRQLRPADVMATRRALSEALRARGITLDAPEPN